MQRSPSSVQNWRMPHSFGSSAVTPVSSYTSRTTEATIDSPGSTCPPGNESPGHAGSVRFCISTLPHPSETMHMFVKIVRSARLIPTASVPSHSSGRIANSACARASSPFCSIARMRVDETMPSPSRTGSTTRAR